MDAAVKAGNNQLQVSAFHVIADSDLQEFAALRTAAVIFLFYRKSREGTACDIFQLYIFKVVFLVFNKVRSFSCVVPF